jgi:probable HAF family extracellular repeat protein
MWALRLRGILIAGVVGAAWGPLAANASPPAIFNLGTPAGNNSDVQDINANGQITGTSIAPSLFDHAFLHTGIPGAGGTMSDLGTLGGSFSEATAINAGGMIAGFSGVSGSAGTHAFLYTGAPGVDGQMHDLGTLGGTTATSFGINSLGQIVGQGVGVGCSGVVEATKTVRWRQAGRARGDGSQFQVEVGEGLSGGARGSRRRKRGRMPRAE